jgi:hypothetical protein
MGIQNIFRFILPKEEHFYDFLEQQAALAHEGSVALARLKQEPAAIVKEAVHAIEKKGDKVAHDLEEALAATFVTPLDREDLHKLSSQLDDILDRAYAVASAFDMYSIDEASEPVKGMFDVLIETTQILAEELPCLRKHDFDGLREASRRIRVLEKQGDETYRKAMKTLFADDSIDARTLIREKEVIEILETAIDGCEDASEFLTNLAVKHG